MIKVKYLDNIVFETFIKKMSKATEVIKIARVKNTNKQTQVHAFCVYPIVDGVKAYPQNVWVFSNNKNGENYECLKINGKEIVRYTNRFNKFVNENCEIKTEEITK